MDKDGIHVILITIPSFHPYLRVINHKMYLYKLCRLLSIAERPFSSSYISRYKTLEKGMMSTIACLIEICQTATTIQAQI